jgi:hypothetical protein
VQNMANLHQYDNRHIKDQVHNISKGDVIWLQNALSKKRWSLMFKYYGIDETCLKIKYITNEEYEKLADTKSNKKFTFDVVLSNPPYSNGDILLYPGFFEKNLKLGKLVKQVMPVDLDSQQVRVKTHNKRVKKHMIEISNNVTDQFNVGIPDIRYVTASLEQENEVKEYVDPLDSHQILMPHRKRLEPRRGVGGFSRKSNFDPNGVDVMLSIYRGNKIQWTKVKKDLANKTKTALVSKDPYFVLVAENPSNGLFNTAIVKNDGTKWGSGIFGLSAKNIKEANTLEQWLVSDAIQEEVRKILKLKNTHSFSGPMMEKLPWYE